MKVMILAAGLGTRMRPLTDHCPKPLLDVAGKPLIVRHIERLVEADFRDLVINTSHMGEMIEARLGDGSAWGASIVYSREAQPLETAGGIVKALPLLGESAFVVLNGDIWCDMPLAQLRTRSLQGLGHLILVNNPDHNPSGDFEWLDGKVLPRGDTVGYTFSGLSILHPDLFSGWRSRTGQAFPLREVLLPALGQGLVSGEIYEGYWLDVGTPERLQILQERFSRSG